MKQTFETLVKSKGKSKAAVGRSLGVSGQVIGQYISGRQKPKLQFVAKWKEVYGEDITPFFETNVSQEKAPETSDWLQRLDKLIESNDRLTKTNEKLASSNEQLVAAHIRILEKINLGESDEVFAASPGKEQVDKTIEILPPFGGKQGKSSASHRVKQSSTVVDKGK